MAPKKTPITITFSTPSATPPVYVAGTFFDPTWAPLEMDYTENVTGGEKQFRFYKELLVEPGQSFQYKFRVGEGFEWICDETGEVVTNNAGKRCNITVAPISTNDSGLKKTTVNELKGANLDDGDALTSGTVTPYEDRAPLFAYECIGPYKGEEYESPPSPVSLSPPTSQPHVDITYESDINSSDPLLEEFPNDLAQILSRISSTEARLDADQTRFEGVPISPVVRPGEVPTQEYFSQRDGVPKLQGGKVEVHEFTEVHELLESIDEVEEEEARDGRLGNGIRNRAGDAEGWEVKGIGCAQHEPR